MRGVSIKIFSRCIILLVALQKNVTHGPATIVSSSLCTASFCVISAKQKCILKEEKVIEGTVEIIFF